MLEPGRGQSRINIPYFDGVNNLVSFNLGKKTELVHVENARSKTVGTIEKREGQTVYGTNINGLPFVTQNNYGLFQFTNGNTKGLYRISINESPDININIIENINISGSFMPTSLSVYIKDSINITEIVNDHTGTLVTLYYINSNDKWIPLTGNGTNIPGGVFDYTYAEGCVFLVNGNSENRYIKADGTTVITSTSGAGHLFNTPKANRINFYKNRLYLADFIQNGNRYKTTILRSSYPMGLISLINADYTDAVSGSTIEITDTKYFYSDSGANTYDIYRGQIYITTITVTSVGETTITATWTGTPDLQASDEIWISGTYDGTKIFRWVKNSTMSGKEVKQYDTFKLSGGENDEITMLTNIGNVMLVSNRNSMASWNDYILENFDLDIGCVSKKGYVKVRGVLYFLHYGGVYSTSGSSPKIISNKIEKYISGATKSGKEACAAGKKGSSIFFTLGDVTLYKLDGSINKILKDVCIEFNLIQENWYVHTNVKASEFTTFVEENDSDRLEFTDTSENHSVKEFLSGETDDGHNIHFRIDTMKLTTGVNPSNTSSTNFEYSSKLIALLTEAERGAAMRCFVNLENEEEYYPIEGTISKGLSVLKITDKDPARGKPPYCRLVSLSIRDSSPQICKLSRMTLITLPTTDENSNSDE